MKLKVYLICSEIDDFHYVESFASTQARDVRKRELIAQMLDGTIDIDAADIEDDEKANLQSTDIEEAWMEFMSLLGGGTYYWLEENEVDCPALDALKAIIACCDANDADSLANACNDARAALDAAK